MNLINLIMIHKIMPIYENVLRQNISRNKNRNR